MSPPNEIIHVPLYNYVRLEVQTHEISSSVFLLNELIPYEPMSHTLIFVFNLVSYLILGETETSFSQGILSARITWALGSIVLRANNFENLSL